MGEEGSESEGVWWYHSCPSFQAILQFWKLRLWDWSTVEGQMVSWYDGFSTFHIGSDGLIHLHVADSVSVGVVKGGRVLGCV